MSSPVWERILIHHSAGRDGVASDFEAILHQHVHVNGWRTIGYHALIERVGSQVVDRDGRPDTMIGSHCPGQNSKALGVCLVGNFETEHVGTDVLAKLIGRLERWCIKFNIPPEAIYGHRDFRQTLCPGANLYRLIPSLREKVAELIDPES